MFSRIPQYKAGWHAGQVTLADRFYASTRRWSACSVVGDAVPLPERTFRCSDCGHEADRDTNAAVNLALWPRVAVNQVEKLNVCGEGRSAGEQFLTVRETRLDEPGRASARRPRRAALAHFCQHAVGSVPSRAPPSASPRRMLQLNGGNMKSTLGSIAGGGVIISTLLVGCGSSDPAPPEK